MIDEFRRHPKVAGWLYTEHHDVVNEWNGYVRDRVGAAVGLVPHGSVAGGKVEGDFMRGKGTHDPGLNPNAYPMTDGVRTPSAARVVVNGVSAGLFDLPDDPADHRGVLSWHAQKRGAQPRLDEAGSYGTLVSATVPAEALRDAAARGEIVVRLEVDESLPGGLAVYGEEAGRYPLDPSLVLTLRR